MPHEGRSTKQVADDAQGHLNVLASLLEKAKGARRFMDSVMGTMFSRHPAGSPKGGQFAPAGTGGGGGGGPPVAKVTVQGLGGAPSAPKQSVQTPTKPAGGNTQRGGLEPHYPDAKQHPAKGEGGKAVQINEPHEPTPLSRLNDSNATATIVPGQQLPADLNGVALKPWADAPKTAEGWQNVAGQKPELDADLPDIVPPPGKTVGAGLIITEPDGRVWLTAPTNGFGGYDATFPKGTAEKGIPSLQANAIKEAYEETGLQVEITGHLGDFARTTSVARFYTAKRVGGTPADMGWESQAVHLVPPADLFTKLNNRADDKLVKAYAFENDVHVNERMTKPYSFGKAKAAGGKWMDQPRWESGTPIGGQWKAYDADGITLPPAGIGTPSNQGGVKKAAKAYQLAKSGNVPGLQLMLDETKKGAEDWTSKNGKGVHQHSKDGAKVHQYVGELLGQMGAAVVAEATAEKLVGPDKLSGWKKTGTKPGGSNPGAVYTDPDGVKWLVKGNAQLASGAVTQEVSDMRARNEVLAANLMKAAGIPSPDVKLVDLGGAHGGGLGVAVRYIDGIKAFGPADLPKVQQQFAVHAWLANYDAIGMSNDNTVKTPAGELMNIDPGGALLFRAQGAPKAGFTAGNPAGGLGPFASEWESMRKPVTGIPNNAAAHAVYGPMTDGQLKDSAKLVAGMSNDTIKQLCAASGLPGQEKLAERLIQRRDSILQQAGVDKAGQVTPAPTPQAPVAPLPAPESGIPKPNVSPFYQNVVDGAEKAFKAGDHAALESIMTDWIGSKSHDGAAVAQYASELAFTLEDKLAQASAVVDGTGTTFSVKDGVATATGAPSLPPKPTFTGPKASFYDTVVVAKVDQMVMSNDKAGLEALALKKNGNPLFPAESANGKKAAEYMDAALKSVGSTETYASLTGPKAPVVVNSTGMTPAAPAAMPEKPDFPGAAYKNVVEVLEGHHKDGNLTALENAAVAWKADPISGPTGKKIAAYAEGLKANLIAKTGVEQPAATSNAMQISLNQAGTLAAKGDVDGLQKLVGDWATKMEPGNPEHEAAFAYAVALLNTPTLNAKAETAQSAAMAAPSTPKVQMMVVVPSVAEQYQGALKSIDDMAAAGNLAGLKSVAKVWSDSAPGTDGAKVANYAANMANVMEKEARNSPPAAIKMVETPDSPPKAVAPALPDFSKALLPTTNANAASHNPKVQLIEKLAKDGDEKGILSLNYGTNTYGKKQAALANDALAAIGSAHAVVPGQKKNGHPAILAPGTVPQAVSEPSPMAKPAGDWLKLSPGESVVRQGEEFGVKWAKVSVPAKGFDAATIPPPPVSWNSSVQAINDANKASAQLVYDTAMKAQKPEAIDALSFPLIDKATGKVTGSVPLADHPSKNSLSEYVTQVKAELKAQTEPTFKTVQSGNFSDSYSHAAANIAAKAGKLSPDQIKGHAKKAADYCVISEGGASKLPVPKEGMFKEKTHANKDLAAFRDKSKAAFDTLTAAEKQAAKSYTGSAYAAWNTALRQGDTLTQGAKDMVKAFAKAEQELPEGTILWRGIDVGEATYNSVTGSVVQDGSFQSASYGHKPAFGGKQTWLRLHVPKGVKALDATVFSGFGTGESEIILSPNQRYAILKTETHKSFTDSKGNKHGKKTIIDVLVLPN